MNARMLISVALLLLCSGVDSAAQRRKSKLYQCDKNINSAIERFERGRHSDAAATLKEVQFQCGGHGRIDTVTYYLGMALLLDRLPDEAKSQFRRLVDNYPNSSYAVEARFRIGQCSYEASGAYDRDQTETREAIRELRDFVLDAPQSAWADSARAYIEKCMHKLSRREYENARFYYRLDKYDAAIVYFMELIQEYPDSPYTPDARLQLAQSLVRVNRSTEAESLLQEVVAGDFAEDIKRRARLQLERLSLQR